MAHPLPQVFTRPRQRGKRAFARSQLTIVPSRVVSEPVGPSWREQLALACAAIPALLALGVVAAVRFGAYEPDALARVYSAARTVRGNRPALANVGFIWPPLPTLVEIPFALVRPLVTTGLAAVCMSVIFAALALILLNRILYPYVPARRWRFAFLAAYQLNIMILIYSINGMTEIPMICFTLLGVWGVQRLFQPDPVREVWGLQRLFLVNRAHDERYTTSTLVLLGAAAALGFLTRFEALSLTLVLLAAVLLLLRDRKATRAQYEAYGLFTLLPVVFAVGLLISFAWLITGNPLYFVNGKGSNAQSVAAAMAMNPALAALKGDLGGSIGYVATVVTQMYPAAWLALAALVAVALRFRDRVAAILALLLVSFPAFQVPLHFLGQSHGWVRYQIYAVPLTIIGLLLVCARVAPRWQIHLRRLVLLLLVLSSVVTFSVIYRDGGALSEADYVNALFRWQASDRLDLDHTIARYLLTKDANTRIFADEQQTGRIALFTGQFERFIGTDSPNYRDLIADPAANADYILVPDSVDAGENYIVARYPDIYEQGGANLTLEREWIPANKRWWEHSFRLYRINRPTGSSSVPNVVTRPATPGTPGTPTARTAAPTVATPAPSPVAATPPATPTVRATPTVLPTASVQTRPLNWSYRAISLTAYWEDELLRSGPAIDAIAAAGADSVTFSFSWYSPNINSPEIYRTVKTPSDESLLWAIRYARSRGLTVVLKPNVDVEDGTWRGFVNPQAATAWFANYSAMLNHYADLGQREQVRLIIIGGELIAMSTNPYYEGEWRSAIGQVRSRYKGQLTYSANWGRGEYEEFSRIRFWDALDFLGLSAYFELTDNNAPTAAQLRTSWEQWNKEKIAPFQARWQKPLLFTEIGYRSMDGAASIPWNNVAIRPADFAEQALAYQVLFDYWSNVPWLAGISIWETRAIEPVTPTDTGYNIHDKPAEAIVAAWFRRR